MAKGLTRQRGGYGMIAAGQVRRDIGRQHDVGPRDQDFALDGNSAERQEVVGGRIAANIVAAFQLCSIAPLAMLSRKPARRGHPSRRRPYQGRA